MKKAIILLLGLCISLHLAAQEEVLKAQQKASEAMQQYYAKDYKTSLKSFEEAFKIKEVQNDNNLYNAACSAALSGEKTKAWKYLEQSIAAGFKDYEHIFKDEDLATLHNDAKWKKMQDEKGFNPEKVKKAFASLKTEAQLYDLVPYKKGELWGYMQFGTKKIIVEPMFTKAEFYYTHYEGYWSERKEDKRLELDMNGYELWVRANGEIVTEFPEEGVPPPMMEIGSSYQDEPFRPKADKEGLGFTTQLGTIVSYSKDYEGFSEKTINNQLCALVKYKGLYGIVDEEGNPIAPNFAIQYKVLYAIGLDGGTNNIAYYAQNASNEKWSVLATSGEFILQELDDSPHHDGQFFMAKSNAKWGVFNEQGKMIIKPKYTESYHYVFSNKIVDGTERHFFQFKLEGDKDFFYVDENGVEYR